VFGGFNPAVNTMIQSMVESGYRHFIALVAASRKMTPQRVDSIAQGRVWDGGTARQLGLVDRFGGLQAAIDEAAKRAGLDPAKVHPVYLEKEPGWLGQMLVSWADEEDEDAAEQGGDMLARIATARRALLVQALGDARRLAGAASMQARCLECAGLAPPVARNSDLRLAELLLAKIGL
jgi:protease IV